MDFLNAVNDSVNEVKMEIPESSKCRTVIIKNMMWKGKIRKKINRPPIGK